MKNYSLFIILSLLAFSCKDKASSTAGSVASQDQAAHNHEGHDHDGHDHAEAVKEAPQTIVLRKADVMPQFPGCDKYKERVNAEQIEMCSTNMMMDFIQRNLVYPKTSKDAGVKGVGGVEFTVNTDGTVTDIKIFRSLDKDCDQSIINTIESMNRMSKRWTPGMNQGSPVAVRLAIPVNMEFARK